ncbi:hypothetical protein [Acetobacter cerevisiae]|uniref:hypothetical protein n=1 Tax=Acetobacter cerevisiae TaxID=178900 RepID=UPI00209D6957|nr:hypothetical protein [Acetobacter cerevisiae]MCP1271995.1 hypothetical protein [Acetobacter cerevisiae]MCP1279939.1 hypothetical protein [Acetobacter cerevisiae]
MTATVSTSTSTSRTEPTWQETDYPAGYYAYSNNTELLDGYPRVGWVDVSIFSAKPDWLPNAASMIPLTEDQWNARQFVNQVIKDGQVVTETPDVPVIPLKTQASSALSTARTYVYNNYGILNESTPDNWVTYLKALMAIANGTDTTSQALPVHPADGLTAGTAVS